MGCSSCGGSKMLNGIKNSIKPIQNTIKAAATQPNKIKWLKDGISGLYKCITQDKIVTDDIIVKNRDICRECEFASKTDGKLTMQSQCLAKDPETGQICSCLLLCKTQIEGEKCPMSKWVNLTISNPK